MNEAPNHTLSCPGCGKRFAWQPHMAGRRVACKCGTVFEVSEPAPPPPPPADDVYGLIEEPAAPSSRPAEPVLSYESKVVVKEERRRIRDRILEQWHIRDLWLPITLVVLGVVCKLLVPLTHHTDGLVRAVVVMSIVGLGTAFNVLLMFAAVIVSSRLVDMETGPTIPTIVKLGLMFVAAASAGGLIANLAHFDGVGVAVGVNAVILIYWILFALLFKAGLTETMMTVAIMGILQAILNVGLWKM